ncbi:mitochondrial 54S ribosomal protein uL22m [Dipodascopsis tothii]|uniref:mitochondrial 54S ribosomal protein uL22m n=1 Tax=Dipodascopsis tothii TaxID=44089 RepID=UPI0034CF7C41
MEVMHPKPLSVLDAHLTEEQKAVYLAQEKGIESDLAKNKRLRLTKEQRALLEPSLFLHSYTHNGSVKKVTPLLRSLRGMDLKQAITHCHFNSKKLSRDLEAMFIRGLEEAKQLGMPEQGLYIEQIWAGKEPRSRYLMGKMIDFKGRGRTGIITRREHHVKCVIRTPETKQRLARDAAKREVNKKVWVQLPNKPVYFKPTNRYQW